MKKKMRSARRTVKAVAPIAMPAMAPLLRLLELEDELFEGVEGVELEWLIVIMLAGLPRKSAWEIEKFLDS